MEDGRRYVSDHAGPWDVIVVDAFYSDSIPFHLATREFLELARSRLAPGGLVITNIIGAVRARTRDSCAPCFALTATASRRLRCTPCSMPAATPVESVRNIIFVAGEGAAPEGVPLDRWRDIRRDRRARRTSTRDPDRVDAPISTQDVPVLTDDYAPTDALLLLFG